MYYGQEGIMDLFYLTAKDTTGISLHDTWALHFVP